MIKKNLLIVFIAILLCNVSSGKILAAPPSSGVYAVADTLRVMSFNILVGGGKSIERIIAAVKESRAIRDYLSDYRAVLSNKYCFLLNDDRFF
jgi:gamma-glutamyltranspeptidase